MAAKRATTRYASSAAVYGSNAYDLGRVRQYSNAQAVPERSPRPDTRPATKPVVKTAPKVAPRTQRAYGVSLFAVAGFAVVAALMVFVLLAHVRFNEISSETVALQTQLTALNEDERRLQIAYEDVFDVNEVEEYATNVLGMTKPLESQLATITAIAYDKAVVIDTTGDTLGVKENLATFLSSLVAYFK